MSENMKKVIAISTILFILFIFALHSIITFVQNQKQVRIPLQSPLVQMMVAPAPEPTTPPSNAGHPVVYIPTAEEINQSIEDQNQKQKFKEELMATRNKKAERVVAAVTAALSSPVSQETISKDTPPALSLEERAEHNKELQAGIKVHRYFPR